MLAILTAGGCGGGDAAPSDGGGTLAVTRVFAALSFSSLVAMLQAPGDGSRWFVVERGGRVVVFPNDDAATPAQTSQFVAIAVDTAGEGGLLGMAFHPNFPATPHVYLSYTRTGPDAQHPLTSVIARFALGAGGALNPASEVVILAIDHPFTNHKGGNIAFDRAGRLYIGIGDGGSANDPQNNAQRLNTLLGKMLRIDVDAPPAPGKNYAIPSDNPFANGIGGLPEIYAWGLRNPWRWSFDRTTGLLWAGDVGQGAWEEVDIVERGGNYGWKICEGAHLRGSSAACNAGFVDPVAEYDHAQGRCSITGGYVYRGGSFPALAGRYLYGDFCAGTVWALSQAGAPTLSVATGLSVVSFGEAIDGELYLVDINGGLYRVGAP